MPALKNEPGRYAVLFNIVGGSKRRLNVQTKTRTADGEKAIDEITAVLADEFGVEPALICVREVAPVNFDGANSKPFVRDFKANKSLEAPAPAVIRRMKKTEMIELASELDLDLDPTEGAGMAKPKLAKTVIDLIAKKKREIAGDGDDDE